MAQFTTYISTQQDLEECKNAGLVDSVLIATKPFSSDRAVLDIRSAVSLSQNAAELGLTPVLCWDRLMTNEELEECKRKITKQWKALPKHLRIRDLGALRWAKETLEGVKIHLILEDHSLNLHAIDVWQKYLKDSLYRIVFSIQLTEKKLINFIQTVNTQCEILGAGPIRLFYSARKLLSPFAQKDSASLFTGIASSKELTKHTLRILESDHGTVMYLDRDYFILDSLSNLIDAGLTHMRIDLRLYSSGKRSCEGIGRIIKQWEERQHTKDLWPNRAFSPFFRSNKTTAQFYRLKSPLYGMRDRNCVGIVYSVCKDATSIFLRSHISLNERLTLVRPKGSKELITIKEIRDINGNSISACTKERLVVVKGIKNPELGSILLRE
ncbi:MAG: hypothetical protein D6808_05925 [Candidatus Dadabacteria bacterium]|nr:MAG: hypothetical protein D6808_05925 [Candidatus Dadabacteria bacterium]